VRSNARSKWGLLLRIEARSGRRVRVQLEQEDYSIVFESYTVVVL
jgi:hypothetical protein